jgi:hypothetical protein
MDTHATIEELLVAVFSILSDTKLYSESSRMEAGSITSTVALRVIGDDEKGIWEPGPPGKGSLESETVKMWS